MNLPNKSKAKLTQAFTLITFGLVGFYVASHSPRFDQFRAVDIVLLMSAGMCFGVALSLLLRRAISH
jgi:lipopolysaccharide export LptBFGC system permease protein LptF